ncbi:MAG: septum formation protein Maf [Elusimicrobia bacterium]|nr:septum formation protein Maf [Elusimicrobiota bacterium]
MSPRADTLLPIVLASASPQRKKLLKSMRINFIVRPSHIAERSGHGAPRLKVQELAMRKARAVARRMKTGVVIGADTLVVCRKKILGKPKNAKDAERILRRLNGTWQRVYTGVAVVRAEDQKSWIGAEMSRVKARKFAPEDLRKMALKNHDKSGAYSVQDAGDPFIEKVEGALDNVIGLPRTTLQKLLQQAFHHKRKFAFLPLKFRAR